MASNAWTNSAGTENGGGREITRVQIYKYVTKDRVLDISDMLSVEPRRNKIAFTLLEFDENYKAKTRVRHYADVPDFKLVCHDILSNQFAEWTDHKGTPNGRTEGGENRQEGFQARVLTFRKDTKYRQPFVLKIDNGLGEQMAGGAVKLVQTTDSLTLLMPEWDARRLAQTVLDYIRDWETINFRKRQEAQTIIVGMGGDNADSQGAGDSGEATAPASASANEYATAAAPRRRGRVAA